MAIGPFIKACRDFILFRTFPRVSLFGFRWLIYSHAERTRAAGSELQRYMAHWRTWSIEERRRHMKNEIEKRASGRYKRIYPFVYWVGERHLELFRALTVNGRHHDAPRHLKQARKYFSLASDANRHEIGPLFYTGLSYELENDHRRARKYYRRALKLDRHDQRTRTRLAALNT